MGLINLLNAGVSDFGYSGGIVPSTVNFNTPNFTRHNLFSTTGKPNISNNIKVGGVTGLQASPTTLIPSRLEETDSLNTSKFRSSPGKGYVNNLPQ